MDCPNCGTWNPDDKKVCWRCQTPLPKPEPEVKKKPLTFFGVPVWMMVLIALFLFLPFFWQCAMLPR
ncbi:MAG: hypothetical protein GXP42_05855 [Chloroflexi bacterium]|nr:hypothetical protein [Chloroflexota bacterium]